MKLNYFANVYLFITKTYVKHFGLVIAAQQNWLFEIMLLSNLHRIMIVILLNLRYFRAREADS